MKRNVFILAVIGCVTAAVLCIAGCASTGSGSGGTSAGGGALTIRNMPSGNVMVYVSNYGPISARDDILKAAALPAARGSGKSSPVSLTTSGGAFTGSGSYLVIINSGLTQKFKAGVSFRGGSASVDFNSMTDTASLP